MKHTKILATISDEKCDIKFITSLIKKGLNGVRINTAHQMPKDTTKIIKNVRSVSEKIPIIIDTKGPEIRTRKIESPIIVKKNDTIYIRRELSKKNVKEFITSYPDFIKRTPNNSQILIDDGDIELKIIKKDKNQLTCIALNEGKIKNNKSLNVPDYFYNLPSLTKKDKLYIDYAISQKVDFIAHSFVRNKEDVIAIQKILDKKKSKVKIIAKIENQQGVDNLDEILDHVYGIMVARGDLAIEIPYQKIPSIQKEIIQKCIKRKKLVITATQMLHTMIEHPRPTRAEISDVANAIYDGTDVLMLSGETAYGKYPEEAVKIMSEIAKEIEKNKTTPDGHNIFKKRNEIATFLAHSAMEASLKLPVKAIIADTLSGRTARYLAAFRGKTPIFVQCYDKKVMRELALSYGVRPDYAKQEKVPTPSKFINKTLKPLLKIKLLNKEDLVIVLAGSFGPRHGASFVEISKVKNMLIRK